MYNRDDYNKTNNDICINKWNNTINKYIINKKTEDKNNKIEETNNRIEETNNRIEDKINLINYVKKTNFDDIFNINNIYGV